MSVAAAQLVRRAFSSRSAIRAPPAPSSAAMAPAPVRSLVSSGRVAMMPRAAAEARQALPGTTSGVSTASAGAAARFESQEELIQVGRVSSHRDASTVTRVGESL